MAAELSAEEPRVLQASPNVPNESVARELGELAEFRLDPLVDGLVTMNSAERSLFQIQPGTQTKVDLTGAKYSDWLLMQVFERTPKISTWDRPFFFGAKESSGESVEKFSKGVVRGSGVLLGVGLMGAELALLVNTETPAFLLLSILIPLGFMRVWYDIAPRVADYSSDVTWEEAENRLDLLSEEGDLRIRRMFVSPLRDFFRKTVERLAGPSSSALSDSERAQIVLDYVENLEIFRQRLKKEVRAFYRDKTKKIKRKWLIGKLRQRRHFRASLNDLYRDMEWAFSYSTLALLHDEYERAEKDDSRIGFLISKLGRDFSYGGIGETPTCAKALRGILWSKPEKKK
jgi:hypothetical protein